MNKGVYYNENDRHKVMWLRHLIEEGAIAKGIVDDRPIQSVQPDDLRGFDQHHFFAGIGVWSHALRRAGWPDDEPIWTGSCPCGPFSVAGLQKGFDDPRHLWPEWFRLIRERRPDRILGEQVAAAGAWIDLVQSDLEDYAYAFGSPDLPAAGFGGAHIRQRFMWVADADNTQWWSEQSPWHDGHWPTTGRIESYHDLGQRGDAGGMEFSGGGRHGDAEEEVRTGRIAAELSEFVDGLANTLCSGRPERWTGAGQGPASSSSSSFGGLDDTTNPRCNRAFSIAESHSRDKARMRVSDAGRRVDWLYCRDNVWRPVESGTFPLAPTSPGRVGLLRGYGDAIDAETLTEFIGAYMDCCTDAFLS